MNLPQDDPDPERLNCRICGMAQLEGAIRILRVYLPSTAAAAKARSVTSALRCLETVERAFRKTRDVFICEQEPEETPQFHIDALRDDLKWIRTIYPAKRPRRGRRSNSLVLHKLVVAVVECRGCSTAAARRAVTEIVAAVWTAMESPASWEDYLERAPCTRFSGPTATQRRAELREVGRCSSLAWGGAAQDPAFRAVWRGLKGKEQIDRDTPLETRVTVLAERLEKEMARRAKKGEPVRRGRKSG